MHLIEFNPGPTSSNPFQRFFSMSFEGDYFIGLNDKQTEGTYMWVQGTEATSFTNWLSSFPKSGNAESNRDCVIMSLNTNSDDGKWNTNQCNTKSQFICECADGPCASQWYRNVFLYLLSKELELKDSVLRYNRSCINESHILQLLHGISLFVH